MLKFILEAVMDTLRILGGLIILIVMLGYIALTIGTIISLFVLPGFLLYLWGFPIIVAILGQVVGFILGAVLVKLTTRLNLL